MLLILRRFHLSGLYLLLLRLRSLSLFVTQHVGVPGFGVEGGPLHLRHLLLKLLYNHILGFVLSLLSEELFLEVFLLPVQDSLNGLI